MNMICFSKWLFTMSARNFFLAAIDRSLWLRAKINMCVINVFSRGREFAYDHLLPGIELQKFDRCSYFFT